MFIGVIAPFGYKSKDKQLIIDEYAANIVRRIFKMAETGTTFINIAKTLNFENISTRSSYLKMPGKREYWKAEDVSSILHNEVYIVTLINNQSGSISPRLVKKNSSEDWIIFKNQHEAIIDIQTFENVQKRFHKYVPKKNQ